RLCPRSHAAWFQMAAAPPAIRATPPFHASAVPAAAVPSAWRNLPICRTQLNLCEIQIAFVAGACFQTIERCCGLSQTPGDLHGRLGSNPAAPCSKLNCRHNLLHAFSVSVNGRQPISTRRCISVGPEKAECDHPCK